VSGLAIPRPACTNAAVREGERKPPQLLNELIVCDARLSDEPCKPTDLQLCVHRYNAAISATPHHGMTSPLTNLLEAKLFKRLDGLAPEIRGSLGMRWLNRKHGDQRMAFGRQRELFQVQRRRLAKIRNGLFDRLALGRRSCLWVVSDEAAFVGGSEHSGQLYWEPPDAIVAQRAYANLNSPVPIRPL
jgi:hypothetical protein